MSKGRPNYVRYYLLPKIYNYILTFSSRTTVSACLHNKLSFIDCFTCVTLYYFLDLTRRLLRHFHVESIINTIIDNEQKSDKDDIRCPRWLLMSDIQNYQLMEIEFLDANLQIMARRLFINYESFVLYIGIFPTSS